MRKILIVVDMQNDFIDGSLGTKEAEMIVPNVVNKIKEYDINDIYVTLDTHPLNYLQTQEGKNLPVKHCIKGSNGWKLNPLIEEAIKGAKIYEKPTFGSVNLVKDLVELRKRGEFEIEMVGLCTDICVISNALLIKANLPEVKISVDSSCCAGVTPHKHECALETMRSCQIIVK
jgi:nicotinamidase/pyrazinamidase